MKVLLKVLKWIAIVAVTVLLLIIIRDIYIISTDHKNECCSCCTAGEEVCIDMCCPCTKTIIIPEHFF